MENEAVVENKTPTSYDFTSAGKRKILVTTFEYSCFQGRVVNVGVFELDVAIITSHGFVAGRGCLSRVLRKQDRVMAVFIKNIGYVEVEAITDSDLEFYRKQGAYGRISLPYDALPYCHHCKTLQPVTANDLQ